MIIIITEDTDFPLAAGQVAKLRLHTCVMCPQYVANSKTDPRTPREERAHEEEGKRGRERQIDDDSHEQIYFGSRY